MLPVRAETSAMLYIEPGIEMDTQFGGLGAAFSRYMTGENMFFTDFKNSNSSGAAEIAFG